MQYSSEITSFPMMSGKYNTIRRRTYLEQTIQTSQRYINCTKAEQVMKQFFHPCNVHQWIGAQYCMLGIIMKISLLIFQSQA